MAKQQWTVTTSGKWTVKHTRAVQDHARRLVDRLRREFIEQMQRETESVVAPAEEQPTAVGHQFISSVRRISLAPVAWECS